MDINNKEIKKYIPFIEGIVELFHPLVEAAIHDLESGTIIALYHNISRRKVGDVSPIHELKVKTKDFPDFFKPYYKTNWDGRLLKCTSITIRDAKGIPIGLICLNMDTSLLQDTQNLLTTFLRVAEDSANPVDQYGGQCEDKIQVVVNEYLKENRLSLNHLTRSQKKELVQHLYHKGIFNYKNAPGSISHLLKLSRACVYNYIKE